MVQNASMTVEAAGGALSAQTCKDAVEAFKGEMDAIKFKLVKRYDTSRTEAAVSFMEEALKAAITLFTTIVPKQAAKAWLKLLDAKRRLTNATLPELQAAFLASLPDTGSRITAALERAFVATPGYLGTFCADVAEAVAEYAVAEEAARAMAAGYRSAFNAMAMETSSHPRHSHQGHSHQGHSHQGHSDTMGGSRQGQGRQGQAPGKENRRLHPKVHHDMGTDQCVHHARKLLGVKRVGCERQDCRFKHTYVPTAEHISLQRNHNM